MVSVMVTQFTFSAEYLTANMITCREFLSLKNSARDFNALLGYRQVNSAKLVESRHGYL